MHELSIANAVLTVVRAEAERYSSARLCKVGVRVGELAAVDADALRFSFESLLRGTDLEPLALEIERCPRRHRCPRCTRTFTVVDYDVVCPACGSSETICIGGDELQVAYLEVEVP